MATEHEVERAFSPAPEAEIPDLTSLPGVASVTDPVTYDLEATYLDTLDLTLLRAGVTLRRRTGGPDEGWHLKVPAGDGRDGVRRPVGRDPRRAPVALTRLVAGRTRGAAVVPVAKVDTRREVRRLVGAEGQIIAELADDRVRAVGTFEGSSPVEWREWELELVDGDDTILDAAAKLFTDAGAPPSEAQRKLTQVLGEPSPGPGRRLRRVGPSKPAARVLTHRLVEQVDELLASDYSARVDQADGVHRMRKACRRLRNVLATCRPLLDRSVSEAVRAELRWLARALGDARDAQVVYRRLDDLVVSQAPGQVIGPVVRRVRSSARVQARQSRAEVLDVLGSPRYFALLRTLEKLVAAPPWRDAAERPAEKVLLSRIRKDWKRVQRRQVRAAGLRDDDPAAYDQALHDVRKAAKRLRHGCEAVEAVWSKPAGRMHAAAEEVTEVLGERQDTVVSRRTLTGLAKDATEAGESGFTYGRMHAAEEQTAAELEDAYGAAWAALKDKKLRRWLS